MIDATLMGSTLEQVQFHLWPPRVGGAVCLLEFLSGGLMFVSVPPRRHRRRRHPALSALTNDLIRTYRNGIMRVFVACPCLCHVWALSIRFDLSRPCFDVCRLFTAWWRRCLTTWPTCWRTVETKSRRTCWPTEVRWCLSTWVYDQRRCCCLMGSCYTRLSETEKHCFLK